MTRCGCAQKGSMKKRGRPRKNQNREPVRIWITHEDFTAHTAIAKALGLTLPEYLSRILPRPLDVRQKEDYKTPDE